MTGMSMTSSIRVHRYKMHSRESPASKAALTAAASRLKNGIALYSSFEHWLTRVKVLKFAPNLDPKTPSANPEVKEKPAEIHEANLDGESGVKTLGVSWNRTVILSTFKYSSNERMSTQSIQSSRTPPDCLTLWVWQRPSP